MRRRSKKLIQCICILSAVTIVLFAAVIATSAKERPHVFRDRAALMDMGEEIVKDLVSVDGKMEPAEKVVEQKAIVAQAAVPAEQPEAEKEDEEIPDEDEDWDEDEEDWDEDEDWDEEGDEEERRDVSDLDISYHYDEYYSADDLRYLGVIYAGDFRWTWYSQNVLPGGGLDIPGRHVDENGYICDENDRICLASSDLEWGTVVTTPFGKEGCVYDCGCASGTLDVYVDF